MSEVAVTGLAVDPGWSEILNELAIRKLQAIGRIDADRLGIRHAPLPRRR